MEEERKKHADRLFGRSQLKEHILKAHIKSIEDRRK